ncbi:UNKNOWN [Stylonychia lemnae]|uniref:NadR/Ttd14 AAA domain-containing protein n=1 Tax=Stylonychia lemnae TaxID=5949 RepID=A0A078BAY5_STYLE|nr:UNKNOWN [Stylonychia lemnae]|eukprot:CDW90733.1 UNKNOWN [Stylonychia lemnae]
MQLQKEEQGFQKFKNFLQERDQDQMVTKICLTGGPCAGKTTAMTHLTNVLSSFGYRVFCVPEAATLFQKGGAMINMCDFTFDMQVKFQIYLMKMQINLEDTFHQLAQNEGKKSVLLCDRGLMDGSAYVSQDQWEAVLDEMGWNVYQLKDKRYDLVLHLVTAADGAPDFYNKSNEARYESVEEAMNVDRKLQQAYLGHHNFYIIDNDQRDFNQKIDLCVRVVTKCLGLPTPNSYFKKFLIKISNPLDHSTFGLPENNFYDTFELEETLLIPDFSVSVDSESKVEVYLRKRGKNMQYVHNFEIRYTQNNKRISEQKIITARKYLELYQQKDPKKKTLKKKRTCFIWHGQPYQLDTLTNIEGHPVFLRAEVQDDKIYLPDFIECIRDVTKEEFFTSKNMADLEFYYDEAIHGKREKIEFARIDEQKVIRYETTPKNDGDGEKLREKSDEDSHKEAQ